VPCGIAPGHVAHLSTATTGLSFVSYSRGAGGLLLIIFGMAFPRPRTIAGLPSAATTSDFDEGTVILLLPPLSYAMKVSATVELSPATEESWDGTSAMAEGYR